LPLERDGALSRRSRATVPGRDFLFAVNANSCHSTPRPHIGRSCGQRTSHLEALRSSMIAKPTSDRL
jgi:hypothetical protein